MKGNKVPTYEVKSVIDGQPTFDKPIPEILAEIKWALLSCKHGEAVEFKKKRKPKSQKQLGNTFGNMVEKIKHEANEVRQDGVDGLIKYLKQLDIPKNLMATDDLIMKVLYTIAPTFNSNGEEITLSKMDTKQATDFFKRAVDGIAGYVYIPDPDPNWREKKESEK